MSLKVLIEILTYSWLAFAVRSARSIATASMDLSVWQMHSQPTGQPKNLSYLQKIWKFDPSRLYKYKFWCKMCLQNFELTFSTTFAFKTRPKSRWIFWYRWNRILRSFCGGRCGGFYDLSFLLKSWINLFHTCENQWKKVIIFRNPPYTLIE